MCLVYLKKGWRCYLRSIDAFIIAELLVLLLALIMAMLVVYNPVFLHVMLAGELTSIDLVSIFLLALLAVVISLFQFGIYGIAFESMRRRARVETMFKTIKAHWIGWLGVSIVISIFILPSLLLLLYSIATSNLVSAAASAILLLLLSLLFLLAYPALIDVRNVKKAIGLSIRIALSDFLQLLPLFLFFAFISLLVGMIPLLGFFINALMISPISYATYVSFYKAKKKRT